MPTSVESFAPRFEALPQSLPIFPLSGALLLPRQELPLNIFEPRYLQMVLDALGAGRLIGMVQPKSGSTGAEPVPVYRIGCAGRISFFRETDDRRLLIQLTGVCRFEIAHEPATNKPYRIARPDWHAFRTDLDSPLEPSVEFDDLEPRLKRYAEAHQLQVRWDALKKLPSAELIDFLAVQLPFEAAEKQALVEAKDATMRAEILCKAMDIGGAGDETVNPTRH